MKAKPLCTFLPNPDGEEEKRNHAKILHPNIKWRFERDRDSAHCSKRNVRMFTLLSNENCKALTGSHLRI